MSGRTQERIDRALDGRLSDADLTALQTEVVRDSALRESYVDRVWLEAMLRADRDQISQVVAHAPAAAAPRTAHFLWFGSALIAAAATVVFAFILGGKRPLAPASVPIVAVITQAANTRWAGSTLPTAEGSSLGRGTLALVEGIATLRFVSGVTLSLEAPTTLELISPLHTRIVEGSVTAEVPPAAHGFTVETADLKIVDLGTRFGVTASAIGNTHVFVFDGEVRLDSPAGEEIRHLTAGKAFHFRSGAVGASTAEPRRALPLERIDGWTSIPTSFGRGQDGFVRRGTPTIEPPPLLMVKHSDLPLSYRNERRAFLAFDLSAVQPSGLAEAELVLDPEPSGFGFSSMVSEARFAVYGLIDETLDGWSEGNLTWDNAPLAGDILDRTRLRRLAEFELPRGASGSPLTLRSMDLRDFLRADTNGLVTLILVRETGESEPSGLVHAFASKEHPTARPPTLRVR